MGIHENEETPIPPDAMASIEREADETIKHWSDKREESLKMIQKNFHAKTEGFCP